jgi:predicted CoA-binding protein
MTTNREDAISYILANAKTIAVVGLSSQNHRAGYYVPAYMQEHGYRIVPVNPHLEEALGEQAYPDLDSIPLPVDLVLIFRRRQFVAPLVDQAIAIGAKAVWMQLGIYDDESAKRAEEAGLKTVMNACIMVEHRHWEPLGRSA